MSTKDYELIASVINKVRKRSVKADHLFRIDELTVDLATALQRDNKRFDSHKFLIASGYNVADWYEELRNQEIKES